VAGGIGAAAITAHRGEESGGTPDEDGAPREEECGQQQELQEEGATHGLSGVRKDASDNSRPGKRDCTDATAVYGDVETQASASVAGRAGAGPTAVDGGVVSATVDEDSDNGGCSDPDDKPDEPRIGGLSSNTLRPQSRRSKRCSNGAIRREKLTLD
jgi:hypothetical protein